MANFSALGNRFQRRSGIELLMQDLGDALAAGGPSLAMLGGGNPAAIPEVQEALQKRMQELAADAGRLDRAMRIYDPQRGNPRFLQALAGLFQREYGMNIGPENIAITNGGQTASFFLFNLLGGPDDRGRPRRILFPVMPEYIGYAEQSLAEDAMISAPAHIDLHGGRRFKYRVDFSALPWDRDISAACVSRPTNPTGNVLTLEELRQLHTHCREREAYLIIDNAYGTPFPNIIFREEAPFWDEGVILIYSLSKVGMPGTRTGIVIGPPEITRALSAMTVNAGLANGTFGQTLALPMIEDGELLRLSREVIRPFYETRSRRAMAIFEEAFAGLPLRLHESEGALFLWLWFEGLPVSAHRLYELFKEAGVLVVPGNFFFHSLPKPWAHAQECVRVNYAMDIDALPDAASRMAGVIRDL